MAAEGVQKMSKYVKPVISLDEGMAEGVYAASIVAQLSRQKSKIFIMN